MYILEALSKCLYLQFCLSADKKSGFIKTATKPTELQAFQLDEVPFYSSITKMRKPDKTAFQGHDCVPSTMEPLYCGHLGDLVKCPVERLFQSVL